MLKNYFKIAIAVLKRRKFFTFISLFGISFTLTILIVLTAFVDNVSSSNYPEVNRDRSLYITTAQLKNRKEFRQQGGPLSFHYLNTYVNKMKTPVKIAISSFFNPTNAYINNKKLVINQKFTNEAFWKVMEFEFVEGKPYTQQQINNGERVAVISEDTKKEYFGNEPNVVGKYIEADNIQYRVSGVVRSVPVIMPLSYADMYVPYTLSKVDLNRPGLMGNFTAILMADSKDDMDKMREEYAGIVSKIEPERDFDEFNSDAEPYLASFLAGTPLGDREGGTINKLILVASIFMLLFMLLPALNLTNINVSRILERSSEIGVRKAFGASGSTLTGQFIVENIILTLLGTVIGIALSFIIIQVINHSQLIENMHLSINFTVIAFAITTCLVFGLLSGVYPAWRMSKMPIIKALRAS